MFLPGGWPGLKQIAAQVRERVTMDSGSLVLESAAAATALPAIGAFNEWDPLEEVIVGRLDHACWPDWDFLDSHSVSPQRCAAVQRLRGHWRHYPEAVTEAAQRCLADFVAVLKGEGVQVRRPDPYAFHQPYATPYWRAANGFCAANPRDVVLVIGDTFIECPMAHRGRYFEVHAYRSLLKEFAARGARWLAAPRPELRDDLYDFDHRWPDGIGGGTGTDRNQGPGTSGFPITEHEPVFDAADFVRCGRDIFGQVGVVTNHAGVAWLRRLLQPEFRVHLIESRSTGAYHIDTTFMPLAPGKVLVNPEYVDIDRLPPVLRRWDVLVAPRPRSQPVELAGWMSDWISLNVLMLDDKRVVVEQEQEDLIAALKGWGFVPIPCRFRDYYPFVGSFHCATLDVVRRGTLQSYF